MKCDSCGKEIVEESSFCNYCGKKVTQAAEVHTGNAVEQLEEHFAPSMNNENKIEINDPEQPVESADKDNGLLRALSLFLNDRKKNCKRKNPRILFGKWSLYSKDQKKN